MTGHDKIAKELEKKGWIYESIGWEPVGFNGGQGREGGWYIVFNIDCCSDDNYQKLLDLSNQEFKDGEHQVCAILAYNLKTALEIISKMPEYEDYDATIPIN